MTAPRLTYPKSLRMLKRSEYLALGAKNQARLKLDCFRVVARQNHLGRNRLGLTATKKVGDSVVRNRFKRLAREFFRLNQGGWPQGYDLLFIALREQDPFAERFGGGQNQRLLDFLHRLARQTRPAAERWTNGRPA
ncbi:MAG: ribonuclease P protein component [Deltaproteobacteria bacterium]|jgi:ribonuclease P protein component|nr:ribonuclease P protein component [Deltaproteobacteria bacterium]